MTLMKTVDQLEFGMSITQNVIPWLTSKHQMFSTDQIFTTPHLGIRVCAFLVAMGKSWFEMHLKWIHTSSLKSQKYGQSWSTALRSREFTRSQTCKSC